MPDIVSHQTPLLTTAVTSPAPPAPPTPVRSTWRRFADQPILWVYLFPLICFWLDASLDGLVMSFSPYAFWLFGGLGIVTFAITPVWSTRPKLRPWGIGALLGFASGALAIGLFLLPITLITLALLIGVLGLVPFLTSLTFWYRARDLLQREPIGAFGQRASVVLGAVAVLALPVFVHLEFVKRLNQSTAALHAALARVNDPAEIAAAIRRATGSPWCIPSTCARHVCFSLDTLPVGNPELDAAIKGMLGPVPLATCSRLND